ncbi:hypothetical protein [Aestuariispira insulae]|uniref:MazG-like nucleotide pyrophosphohydrolase family protein n=1 Tax=Aestuariispira insulae TaxID=1461337 RepID=A0A3D9HDY3_9PROT|nr:hypothetical protein [Aestuariispira insulae]RED47678.1 hypothetical protein DFP90_10942 [Aestuariispira insulae]
MANLCDQYQDSKLWKDVFALSQIAVESVSQNSHPLNPATAEIAARLPATLANAALAPATDIVACLGQVLEDLVLLEHHAALTGIKLPPAKLDDLKNRVITLLEDEEDGDDDDYYDEDED